MDDLQQLVQKLQNTRHLEKEEWAALIRVGHYCGKHKSILDRQVFKWFAH